MSRILMSAAVVVLLTQSTLAAPTVVAFDCFPLSGAQEVPATASPGTGVGNAWFDPQTNTLSWRITYSGLLAGATAGHFHGPAAPGSNGGVQLSIGTANPAVGSAVLSASQAADLLAGLWYANVHTSAFPGGEIRGQVVNSGCVERIECFPMNGAQEVPPSPSLGTGTGSAWLNHNDNRLDWYITYGGLSGATTAGHFHGPALPGANAGVQASIGVTNPNSGAATLSATQVGQVLGGLWYANVHTAGFPGGEIRGQIVHVGCPQWVDLGLGKPGSRGTPELVGAGPLTAGSSNIVRLMNAAPGTSTALILGFSQLNGSFKGGTLVPFPDIIFGGLPVDALGQFSLPFVWPVGVPAGVSLWAQEWVSDPAAHKGLAATNGLQLVAQ